MRQRYIQSFNTAENVQAAIDDKLLGKPYAALIHDGHHIDWNTKDIDYSSKYFTIEALADGDIMFHKSCSYSINDAEWVAAQPGTVTVKSGDLVRFKGGTAIVDGMFSGNTISSNVYGNILSLKYGDNFKNEASSLSSKNMFKGSTGLVSAKNLVFPAIVGTNYHQNMFENCTNLTTAPSILPATTLADGCYQYMFSGCKNLTSAPELPADTLKRYCYQGMFVLCSKLSYVKCLATNVTANRCTNAWLQNAPSTGTFVKNPNMSSWSRGQSGIPSGWTVVDAE